jgi:hypothetical protein
LTIAVKRIVHCETAGYGGLIVIHPINVNRTSEDLQNCFTNLFSTCSQLVLDSAMAERGGGRGGRGRRGGPGSTMGVLAQRLGTTVTNLRSIKAVYEPEPTFPNFLVPRPTKLSQEETNAVKYYKNLRNKILEETPFHITGKKRVADDDDHDDGLPSFFKC